MSQRMIYQTEETQGKILRTAEALFLKHGFFRTQMKDVANAVGISRNSLYRYFSDKGDLGFAILNIAVNRVADSFGEALEQAGKVVYPNAREKLIAVLSEVIMGGTHDKEMLFMAEFDAYYSGERIPDDFDRRQDLSHWAPAGNALESLLKEGVVDGSIRDDIEPALLLWLMLSSIRTLRREILTRTVALALPDSVPVNRVLPTLLTLLSDGLKPQC